MQKVYKKWVALFLSIMLLLSGLAVFNVSAETTEPVFESIEEIEATLNEIFTANEPEIVDMIKEQRMQSVDDKYVTLYSNCGPTSVAFQKVLFDNGIYAEDRKAPYETSLYGSSGHEYNLIRINFGGDKDKVTNVVADCTYRQFMRTYFSNVLTERLGTNPTDSQIDEAMLDTKLPMVLVFEYGDYESLDAKINSLLRESGYTTPYSVNSSLKNNYELFAYPPQQFQKTYSKYLTNSQKEKIINSGLLNEPFETDLYIRNSQDSTKAVELEYKGNGVYQCVITTENLGVANNEDFSFTIADENGNTVYGAAENSEMLTPYYSYSYNFMMCKAQVFLNSNSVESIKANMYYCNTNSVIIRIDVRAGVTSPLITMYEVGSARIYGDVDNDSKVTVKDVTVIQMYLARFENNLSQNDLTVANVIKSDEFNIRAATAIQLYLAGFENNNKTGQNIYFINGFDVNYIN